MTAFSCAWIRWIADTDGVDCRGRSLNNPMSTMASLGYCYMGANDRWAKIPQLLHHKKKERS